MSAPGVADSVMQTRELPRFVTFRTPYNGEVSVNPSAVATIVAGAALDGEPTSHISLTGCATQYRVFGTIDRVVNRLIGAE